jgi:hypothetical protein
MTVTHRASPVTGECARPALRRRYGGVTDVLNPGAEGAKQVARGHEVHP